ncbi:MAG: amino acid ABC transporter permease [Liquorilactobacillus ghanensis]|uniref:amino acid ABC transporter permease n=1 Tax=Liquorilactobacillus ghanensis TaxID=399370 RepID=UPI0039E7E9E7
MFDVNYAISTFPQILSALKVTILLAFISTLIGTLIAILIVVIRERKIPILNQITIFLVSFIRGTPIIVQMYVVYYGLPQLLMFFKSQGINTNPNGLSAMAIAVVAYTLNAMANLSESIRSAYHSVDHRQYEAAVSVGLSPFKAITRIVMPQLIANLIPNYSNFFIDLTKDTSLVYNIGIVEIMAKANIVSSIGFKYLETYLDALIIYVLVCWIIAKLFRYGELIVRKRVFQS